MESGQDVKPLITDLNAMSLGLGRHDDEPKEDLVKSSTSFGDDNKETDFLDLAGQTDADITLLVEQVMKELNLATEEDEELEKQSKPGVNKLKKLPLLARALSERQLQLKMIDHGVLNVLKNWIQPLPDGSLPDVRIRTEILEILTDFEIDLVEYSSEQMKKVGLGKVVVSLLRSDEETTANKKLAKDLVYKWLQSIFCERCTDEESAIYRWMFKRPVATQTAGREDGIQFRMTNIIRLMAKQKMTARRKALCVDFDVCQSRKDVIRARAKLIEREHRQKMKTKLKQMKVLQKKSASRHNSQRGTSELAVPDVVVRNLGNHFGDLNMSAVPDPVGNLGNHFGDLKMS